MSFIPASNPPNNLSTEKTYGPVTQLPVKVLPDDLKHEIISRANLVNGNSKESPRLNAMGQQQISQEKPPFSTVSTDQRVLDNAPSIYMAKTTAPPPTQLYPPNQNQNLGQGQPQDYHGQNLGKGQPQGLQGQSLGQGQPQGLQGQSLGQNMGQNLGKGQPQGLQGQNLGLSQPQGFQGQNLGQGQPQGFQGQSLGQNMGQNLGQGQPQGFQGQNLGQSQPQGFQGQNMGQNLGNLGPGQPQGYQGQNLGQGQPQGFQGQGGMGQNLGPGQAQYGNIYPLPPNAVNLMNQRAPNPPYNTTPQTYNPSVAYPPNMGGQMPPNLGPNFSYPPPFPSQGMPFAAPNQGAQPQPIYGAQSFGIPSPYPMLPHQVPGFMPSQSYGPDYGQQYGQQYIPIHLQDRMYQANLAFDMFDANNNGRISFKEWKNALDYLGFNCTQHQARHLFHTVDVNRSGYITRGEFCNWWVAFESGSFVFPSTLLYY